jgi:hypothetical protein
MLFTKRYSRLAYLFISFVLLAFFYQACDDSGILPQASDVDTTAFNFNNLIISERNPVSFDSSFSSIDYWKGKIIQEMNSDKDAVLVDSFSTQFYFRSGDLSLDAPGYRTLFKQFVYPNFTQTNFDTVSVIPDTDDTLTTVDFTSNITNTFTNPLSEHPVYGFYLQGKYSGGVTWKPVVGMVYIDSSWTESGLAKFRIDVKINTAGQNRFKEIFK